MTDANARKLAESMTACMLINKAIHLFTFSIYSDRKDRAERRIILNR